MKKSSAASAANAACDHMHDWWVGTKPGEYASMAVISDGNSYGVAPGLIYSFPITSKNGEWTVVSGLSISEFAKKKLQTTEQELLEERKLALDI
jgi:malate/lactate dehydrogenase